MEDEYKNRFADQTPPASDPDFDAEDLWAGIAAELDHAPPPPPKGSPESGFGWPLLGGLVVIVLLGAGLWYSGFFENRDSLTQESAQVVAPSTGTFSESTSSVSDKPNTASTESADPNAILNQAATENSSTVTDASEGIPNAEITPNDRRRGDSPATNAAPQNATRSSGASSDRAPAPTIAGRTGNGGSAVNTDGKKPFVSSGPASGSSGLPVFAGDAENGGVTLPAVPTESGTTASTNETLNSNASVLDKAKIPTNSSTTLFEKLTQVRLGERPLNLLDLPKSALRTSPPAPIQVQRRPGIGLSMGWYSGLNYLRPSFSGDAESDLRNQYTSGSFGSTHGWSVDLSYRRLELSTGLEYRDLWHEFEAEQRTTTDISVMDHPGQVLVDSTGAVLATITIDTTTTLRTTRTVDYSNRYRLLTIPVTLGYRFGRGNWQVATHAGIGIGFLQDQKGRTLDAAGAIVPLGDEPVLFADRFLEVRLQAVVDYRLTDRWSLRLQPGFSSSQNLLYGSDLRGRATSFGLQGGVSFRW